MASYVWPPGFGVLNMTILLFVAIMLLLGLDAAVVITILMWVFL